ncbi:small nuclear ribonucleoprotein D3-like protein [Cricetulus griseus]|nr:small nuclear ribonucleoprotein D3-like protein [Cricetulus griseus]
MRLPSDSLPAKMSVGGPTKVLHEAEGHTGMCETSADEASHGSLVALPVVHRQSKAELHKLSLVLLTLAILTGKMVSQTCFDLHFPDG